MTNTFSAVVKPHPFAESVCATIAHGKTITEALGERVSQTASVMVGGMRVPRAMWSTVRPNRGTLVEVNLYPQGGHGGKYVRLVLLVALAVVTYGIASGAITAGGLITEGSAAYVAAGVSIVGPLAIKALVPEEASQ